MMIVYGNKFDIVIGHDEAEEKDRWMKGLAESTSERLCGGRLLMKMIVAESWRTDVQVER